MSCSPATASESPASKVAAAKQEIRGWLAGLSEEQTALRLRPLTPEAHIHLLLHALLAVANGHDGIPVCSLDAEEQSWLMGLAQARSAGEWP